MEQRENFILQPKSIGSIYQRRKPITFKLYDNNDNSYLITLIYESEIEGEVQKNSSNSFNSNFEQEDVLTVKDVETGLLYEGDVFTEGDSPDDMSITVSTLFTLKK